jgi:protease I
MTNELAGKRIAILATDGFEQSELTVPLDALRNLGAEVDVVAPHGGEIQGMEHQEKGDRIRVDQVLDEVRSQDYAALVLPGGVANPDTLRTDGRAVDFVRRFFTDNKPVAAICHGPWTLVEAEVVRGRTVTSWPSLKTDLRNAGAIWVDEPVVVDNGLITSRKPDDLPEFCARMIEAIHQGASSRP